MATLDLADTVAAIASPPGAGLRGIVRLSGPQAHAIALLNFRADNLQPQPNARKPSAHAGALCLPTLAFPIGCLLELWPGRRTYTGEPLAEMHTTGSPPLLQAILESRLEAGARLAEPGEFTLRAFLSGRIDLTQAEAVLSVINAHSPAQLDNALMQLAGGLKSRVQSMRSTLLDLLAQTEAGLDFSDEPDVELGRNPLGARELFAVRRELCELLDQLAARDLSNGRPRVVLSGPPNAGKSRLFNALTGHDRVLVSPLAGTTRDFVAQVLALDGLEIELIDTAGDQEPRNAIEASAQSHRLHQVVQADLILDCRPADQHSDAYEKSPITARPRLLVVTKSDLSARDFTPAITTSAATGQGITALKLAIAARLRHAAAEASPISPRCRESLVGALDAVTFALAAVQRGESDEFLALELRRALDQLGKIIGAIVTDDVLDLIFGRFCIGK